MTCPRYLLLGGKAHENVRYLLEITSFGRAEVF